MAVQLEVNPNTVTRTYTLLQEEGTLENQRGIGYFTAADARQKVLDQKREAFVRNELPAIFATMEQVGLTKNDLIDQFETYQKEQKQS
jgi:DNA-binding transcriptional regulator YhcF (GntR family)